MNCIKAHDYNEHKMPDCLKCAFYETCEYASLYVSEILIETILQPLKTN